VNLRTLTGSRVFKLLKATASDWMEDNCLRLSAALSYYSIFSIAPMLVIAISLAGLFFGADAARGEIEKQLKPVGVRCYRGSPWRKRSDL